MRQPARRQFALASMMAMFVLLSTGLAVAQYYPPPPPPYPPPQYPQGPYPPQYPQRPSPPQYPPEQSRYGTVYFSPYAMFSAGHYSGLGVGMARPRRKAEA